MARAKTQSDQPKNDAPLGFEAELFAMANKLRGTMEPSDYKHVALGLIFLKYVSEVAEDNHATLPIKMSQSQFFVPDTARWSFLQTHAHLAEIGTLLDNAMRAMESANPSLHGILATDYARPALNKVMLGELVTLFSRITLHTDGNASTNDSPSISKDVLGRVYEYFLGQFAGVEGKRGGEFYTPRSVVRVLVEILKPYQGRVYDPCCGSGGMFVQSETFVREHGGKQGDIAVFGQESNLTTWRLAKMNLAMRGMNADIRWNNEGSLRNDALAHERFDYILANPPFNVSDWGGETLREDPRWVFGMPPAGNANYAWLQHILYHLKPAGMAGVVLANGSMSSCQSGEGTIRAAMLRADVVDCMVALPSQLFYSTQISACVWILAKNKKSSTLRDRRGEVLFIDARRLGEMTDRTRRKLPSAHIRRIADTVHAWRGELHAQAYTDVPGFCKAVTLEDIARQGNVLTPGRYVDAEAPPADIELFPQKMQRLGAEFAAQMEEGHRLDQEILHMFQRVSGFDECSDSLLNTFRTNTSK